MSRKKKELPLLENITITDIAAEGKAIAKVNDVVIFVPYVVPGDVVDIQVTKKKSHFMEGRVVNIKEYSKERTLPFCEHFGVCGGCKWQNLPYDRQLFYKQKQVTDNLTRIGKVELPNPINLPKGDFDKECSEGFYPILGSAKTIFYRNKLEFTFSNKRWRTREEMQEIEISRYSDNQMLGQNTVELPENPNIRKSESNNAVGFHIPGMFDKVLDIRKCWLQDDISNQIRNFVREYALQNNLDFFDLKVQEGFLRNMVVRTSSTGELMLIMVFFYEDKKSRVELLNAIAGNFPQITSLLYVINGKANDTITDREVVVFKGKDHILEKMEELYFKVGPKSFYQTNSQQAYELYKVTRNFAELTGNELVYDLYTGTGTIANFVAKEAKCVIGIEYVPEAIEDAKINSAYNNIENTLFFAGDMKDILNAQFIEQYGRPDVIITDPPRAGMHQDVIDTILLAEPKRIVYVSCNPATQSRDLALLDAKYKVAKVQPVDMFPHTHHVENVVLLEIKNTY
jgi:23S rRNA (uracil1939-C5)-methyltransferase